MKVLVDMSIWSLAFRRKEIPGTNEEQNRLKELKELTPRRGDPICCARRLC